MKDVYNYILKLKSLKFYSFSQTCSFRNSALSMYFVLCVSLLERHIDLWTSNIVKGRNVEILLVYSTYMRHDGILFKIKVGYHPLSAVNMMRLEYQGHVYWYTWSL